MVSLGIVLCCDIKGERMTVEMSDNSMFPTRGAAVVEPAAAALHLQVDMRLFYVQPLFF